jgi:hypothetical protein
MWRIFLFILVSVVLIALIGVGLWWTGMFGPSPTEQREGGVADSLHPELSISVNDAIEIQVTPGTPLIFELMLRNGPAGRAALAEAARKRLMKELEEQVQTGKLTRQKADEILKREPVPSPPVHAMVITLVAEGFSFSSETPHGAKSLPWKLTMVKPATPTTVTLDEKQIAWATFVVAPEQTASVTKETYRMRAHFENRYSGQWRGKIVSNPVSITVVESKEMSVYGQKKKYLVMVEYYLAIKDYDRAITAAQQVLAVAPQSIDGQILLGRSKEAKGEFRAALEAYEKALKEFDRRYDEEPPPGLVEGLWRMRKQLGIELPVIEEPAQQEKR